MKRSLLTLTILLFVVSMSTHIKANTYTVTEISDNGTGAVNTLSWAINQSNASTGVDDNIVFNLNSGSTLTLSAALPIITDAVTIDGDDDGTNVTVQVSTPGSGGSAFRIFNINAIGETIIISNISIKGGDISAVSGDSYGGGVFLDAGTLGLNRLIITGSKAYHGGGIYIDNTATISYLTNSTVSNNIVTSKGGGIYIDYGTIIKLSNSTISGNTAAGDGGGIYNYHGGAITILNSTINSNTSTSANGGGICDFQGTSITLSNSTITGNTAATGLGGGLFNNGAPVTISNSTITENTAVYGGGIYQSNETINVENTIIVDNSSNDIEDGDYYFNDGTLTDNGYNIIEYTNISAKYNGGFTNATCILYNTKYNVDGISFTAWTKGGTGVSGTLGLSSTLADNNTIKETQTLALSSGSFAIDAGTGTDNDQRGVPIDGVKDIGAYEYNENWTVWTGGISSAWATSGNWSSDPNADSDIGIKGNCNYNPSVSSARTSNSLNVSSGASLTIEDDGSFTLAENLTNNGTFTLQSTSLGTGSLIVRGTATGNIAAQRYIAAWTNGTDGWHHFSSPVETFNIVGSVMQPGTDDDIYRWNEPDGQWKNYKAGDPTQIESGKGYLTAWASEVTKSIIGIPNNSDIVLSNLTYTTDSDFKGWHLLGNPFQSALLWNHTTGSAGWNLSNVGSAKIWNESNASYTDLSQNDPVPAMQGFLVYASSATNSITIPKIDRDHSSQNWYKNAGVNHIELTVYDTEGSTAQESNIIINRNATTEFDMEFDSYFFAGYAPIFYSATTYGALSTNAIPEIAAQTSISMSFIKNSSSSYYIEVKGVNNLEPPETVYLTDLKTNHTQILNDTPIYEFTAVENDVIERFVIHFCPLSINNFQLLEQINVFTVDNRIEIRTSKLIDAEIGIYSISGHLIDTEQLNNENNISIKVLNYKGVAIVSIKTADQTLTEKVIIW